MSKRKVERVKADGVTVVSTPVSVENPFKEEMKRLADEIFKKVKSESQKVHLLTAALESIRNDIEPHGDPYNGGYVEQVYECFCPRCVAVRALNNE